MSDEISIVIPTYERAHVLERTLDSYATQVDVREVILIDDGGSEANASDLRDLASVHGNTRVVRLRDRVGQPQARMHGVQEASTDYVLFGEDDVILGPEFSEVLLAHGRAMGAEVVAGAVVYLRPSERISDGRGRYLAQPAVAQVPVDRAVGYRSDIRLAGDVLTPFLPGLMLVNRRVFDRLAFDSHYRGNAYREETDFTLRAWRSGIRSARCPHALCFHLPRAEVVGGGQHRMPGWRYELSAIANNWRFLARNAEHLRASHGIKGSNIALQLRFIMDRARSVIRAKIAASKAKPPST